MLSQPIASDFIEISFSQNLLDNFGMPHEIQIDFQKIIDYFNWKNNTFSMHQNWDEEKQEDIR